MLKPWLPVFLLGALVAGTASAETPEAIVRGIYAGGLTQSSIGRLRSPENRARYFQPGLVKLLVADDRTENLCIDFAITGSGQDYDDNEITRTLRIESKADSNRAAIDVRFRNFGEPNHIRYDFVRAGELWKIADIASLSHRWRLSKLRC
ncbi:YbjP/YqhG family protein [Boseaceae bacterium BT-24-1]|nr:YbjP/YqhG family protein [Boseaceae bacterium BT-24-1]